MNRLLVGLLLLLPAITPAVEAQSAPCGLPDATFCDTFDAPAGIGNRSGDLNGTVWGVSRANGTVVLNQKDNAWAPTDIEACDGTLSNVTPPHDILICDGQLREATNDNHDVTVLAMYPKQPFDFAGRTGKVVFDVSNDSLNTHDAWPEFWMSDKPVPTPFNHFDSWQALPQNGFGVRMAAGAVPGQFGFCPSGRDLDKQRWTVDSAVVVRDWVMDDTEGFGTRSALSVKQLDCVVAPDGPNGGLNHVELDIAQNQIDVYATDAGTTAPLRHLAVISNANLTLTRGLIWLEDVHYNAAKACCDENGPHRVHTFAWDNVGFDGPFTFRDLSFDAPDNDKVNALGTINLGRFSGPNQSAVWSVPGMPASPTAAAVRVLFNFFDYTNPSTIAVTVNGHAHSLAYPYPDNLTFTWRTIDVQIPLEDLVAGTNVVTIGSAQAMLTSNVNIVLSDVGEQPAPTLQPTPVPTDTPQPTATPIPVPTAVPAATYIPWPDCEINVRLHSPDGQPFESGWHSCFILQSADPNAQPTPAGP